jgi:hypothetical protein
LIVIVWVTPRKVQKLTFLTQLLVARLDYMPGGWMSGLAVVLKRRLLPGTAPI